jgi:DNA-binding transcriptional ArsR family regulator
MPQGFITDNDDIIAYGTEVINGGTRTVTDIAAHFGVTMMTVRKALLGQGRPQRPSTSEKESVEGKIVLDAIVSELKANVWPPSQRDLADLTGLTPSRVNYLLQVLRHAGLIELGPNSREIRIFGAKMVIPEVSM